MFRGHTPTRNFRLTDRTMDMLDAIVKQSVKNGYGLSDGDHPTRTSILRWLIRTEFQRLETAAREKLERDLLGEKKRRSTRKAATTNFKKGK